MIFLGYSLVIHSSTPTVFKSLSLDNNVVCFAELGLHNGVKLRFWGASIRF